jgi:glycerophosphoryl diester phosphodiesterase
MRKILRYILIGLVTLAAFVFFNNTNLLASRTAGAPVLLAHRGIAQQFDTRDLKNDTCTASRMLPPTHEFLENTIASMRASFEAGADIVEIDVHPTTDGEFAVFHDWTVDCRTDGHGVTREQSMEALKKLDIGYGYTADGGKSFPFRGKGIGPMPSLEEVLVIFPDRRFLINIKSNDQSEGQLLAHALGTLPAERRERLMVYGGDAPVAALSNALPDIRTMSRNTLKTCLLSYIGYGWTGVLPEACQNTIIYVPINVASWLWGWPNRFLSRMESAGSSVFVIGPYHGGEFSSGIDKPDDFARLPAGYSGGIMTNEIETIANATGRSNRQ